MPQFSRFCTRVNAVPLRGNLSMRCRHVSALCAAIFGAARPPDRETGRWPARVPAPAERPSERRRRAPRRRVRRHQLGPRHGDGAGRRGPWRVFVYDALSTPVTYRVDQPGHSDPERPGGRRPADHRGRSTETAGLVASLPPSPVDVMPARIGNRPPPPACTSRADGGHADTGVAGRITASQSRTMSARPSPAGTASSAPCRDPPVVPADADTTSTPADAASSATSGSAAGIADLGQVLVGETARDGRAGRVRHVDAVGRSAARPRIPRRVFGSEGRGPLSFSNLMAGGRQQRATRTHRADAPVTAMICGAAR